MFHIKVGEAGQFQMGYDRRFGADIYTVDSNSVGYSVVIDISERRVARLPRDNYQCLQKNDGILYKCVENYIDLNMGCNLPWRTKPRPGNYN